MHRVETFAVGDDWGWRGVAHTGVTVCESDLDFTSKDEALEFAYLDERTASVRR